jgi:lambda family phage portal protein
MNGHDTFGGVEVSQWGHIVGYWFYTGHPLASRQRYIGSNQNRWVFIPAYGKETGLPNVLHLMKTDRPGQRRGIPLVAPVVEMALVLDRYMKAEATAAQIQALFALVVTSENVEATMGEMQNMMGGNDDRGDIRLAPGIVQYARPGESVTAVNPSRPTTAFESFINSTIQMMGPSLGIPHELLMQSFKSSYSASRAAMNMANAGFKVMRAGLVNDFCQPIYEAFMDEAVAKDMISIPNYFTNALIRRAVTRAKWNGPGMPQIDGLKETQEYELKTALGFATAAESTAELTGQDWSENIKVRSREIQMAKDAGLSAAAAEALTNHASAVSTAEGTDGATSGDTANGGNG